MFIPELWEAFELFACGQCPLVANRQSCTLAGVNPKHIDPVTPVPLGRSEGETAPEVSVETPDCDVAEEEPQRVNHSRSIGCLTGCRPRYSPSCLSSQPWGIESAKKTLQRALLVTEEAKKVCINTFTYSSHVFRDCMWKTSKIIKRN